MLHQGGEIRWVEASYTAIYQGLTNPVYTGAYVYGRTRHEIVLDATGGRKKRVRHLPRAERQVLIPEHHPGFIDVLRPISVKIGLSISGPAAG